MLLTDFSVTPFFPQSGMTIQFDWFTLAYAIIIVICLLLGIFKGFMNTLVNALGGIAVLVLAFLLAKPVGNLLCNSFGWGESLSGTWYNFLVSKSSDFSASVDVANAEAAISAGLESAGIPGALCGTVLKLALPFVPAEGTFVVGVALADALTNYCFIAGAFIVLVIVFGIVLVILKKLIKGITEIKLIKVVDKLLGAAAGLVLGVTIVAFISYGLSFLISVPQCSDFITNSLFLNDDTVWTFSKAVYNYNLVGKLFELYV